MIMDSSIEGKGGSSDSTALSIDERRQLIHALSKQPKEASEVLHSWSRHVILKILCAEMGKERKYTGLTKSKLIENLLNLVSPSSTGQRNSKRKQKTDISESSDTVCCKNSACRAVVGSEDEFCKRCSCCVCHKYDDNKDPSLWLTCGCGLSCHLECAFNHGRSAIGRLDGRFYCVSCGKENDLLGCWRKQMKVAKETRRVDILCHRVYLGQKLLRGTSKYRILSGFMDEAVKKLEADVGPLHGLAQNMARGIVNRLASGPCVQELCSSALVCLDKMRVQESELCSDPVSRQSSDCVNVRVEDIQTRSVTVSLDSDKSSSSQHEIQGFRLFCRKSNDKTYPTQAISVVYLPDTSSTITGLNPATAFSLKAIAFNAESDVGTSELQFSTMGGDDGSNHKITERSQSPLTISSCISNPSSMEDESNNVAPYTIQNSCKDDNNVESCKIVKACNVGKADGLLQGQINHKRVQTEGNLPVTPCKTDTQGKRKRIKRSKADSETGVTMTEDHENGSTKGKTDIEECNANRVPDKDLEHIVKTIRCLEQEGHIDKGFRERFITWCSLRATHREVRIVKLFIETFMEDLSSLGEQLVDTFSECILSKKRSTAIVPAGFCLKLWH